MARRDSLVTAPSFRASVTSVCQDTSSSSLPHGDRRSATLMVFREQPAERVEFVIG